MPPHEAIDRIQLSLYHQKRDSARWPQASVNCAAPLTACATTVLRSGSLRRTEFSLRNANGIEQIVNARCSSIFRYRVVPLGRDTKVALIH
jgi:hypothetical protein